MLHVHEYLWYLLTIKKKYGNKFFFFNFDFCKYLLDHKCNKSVYHLTIFKQNLSLEIMGLESFHSYNWFHIFYVNILGNLCHVHQKT